MDLFENHFLYFTEFQLLKYDHLLLFPIEIEICTSEKNFEIKILEKFIDQHGNLGIVDMLVIYRYQVNQLHINCY